MSVERSHKIENPKCVRSKETELGIGIFQLISYIPIIFLLIVFSFNTVFIIIFLNLLCEICLLYRPHEM